MPIFKLTANNSSLSVVVRAKCLSCARSVAADTAGSEGPMIWRNPEQSDVELVRHDGGSALILRGTNSE